MTPPMDESGKGLRRLLAVVPSMGLGGAERQASSLLRELATMNWDVALVTLDSGGPFFDEVARAGIPACCLNLKRRLSPRVLIELSRHMRDLQPDVILLRGFSAATLGRLAAVMNGHRAVVVVAEHSTGRHADRTRTHDLAERALIPVTDAFVGVADGQQDFLIREKRLPRERLWTIRNGINIEPYLHGDREAARQLLGLDRSAFVVGIVAALRPEKDHGTFLRAARALVDRFGDARFVIVGDGPERLMVQDAVSRLSLDREVHLLGARTDVERILPAFDVYTLSSTVEAFPISVLEAMGAGLPVVATRVGGLPELVAEGETGFLVPPNEPDALASAWSRLSHDPDLAGAMGAAGRAKVLSCFSDRIMAEQHVRLFEQLIDQRHGAR